MTATQPNCWRSRLERRPGVRRGSIYIVTLMTSLIVATMAIAAIATVRVQRRHAADGEIGRQAQLHAESALELARYFIRTQSAWRSDLSSGRWSANQAIGTGFYSFTGVDPIDGDLLDDQLDPVMITAVGKQADCVHSVAARFEFVQPGLNCLQSAVHAGNDLNTDKVTLTSSGASLSSNNNILIGPQSVVTANCEAVGTVSKDGTATWTGTGTNGVAAKQMPNSSQVVSYYQNLGTAISASSLPLWDREYLQNPGAEAAVVPPWVASNCAVALSSSIKRSGVYSFYVYNRTVLLDGVKQDITSQIAQNVPYNISGSVYVDNLMNQDNFRLHILLRTSNGDVSLTSGWFAASVGIWTNMSFTTTPTWTGTLNQAFVFIQSSVGLTPFYFDDVSIKETNAVGNTYVIHRKLLSPQSNPFTGVLNGQGIYVLDCAGKTINIRDSRINGTLLMLGPSTSSCIENSLHLEPNTFLSTDPRNPNLPALIIDKEVKLNLSNAALDESITNTNFNPTGSGYRGTTDSDRIDQYPSQISGVIFSSDKLLVGARTTIFGAVVGITGVDIAGTSAASTSVVVTHQPLYYYVNPPIGFRAAPVVKLQRGSAEQIVQ